MLRKKKTLGVGAGDRGVAGEGLLRPRWVGSEVEERSCSRPSYSRVLVLAHRAGHTRGGQLEAGVGALQERPRVQSGEASLLEEGAEGLPARPPSAPHAAPRLPHLLVETGAQHLEPALLLLAFLPSPMSSEERLSPVRHRVREGRHGPQFFVGEALLSGIESALGCPELEGGPALEHLLLRPRLLLNFDLPLLVESLLLAAELLLQLPQAHLVH